MQGSLSRKVPASVACFSSAVRHKISEKEGDRETAGQPKMPKHNSNTRHRIQDIAARRQITAKENWYRSLMHAMKKGGFI